MAILVRPADWNSESDSIRAIRETVFVLEQKVPAELEWDDQEGDAQHFLVFKNERAVGTGRLSKDGKVGRMAISKSDRGEGLGAQLLQVICEYAEQRGYPNIYLHAQQHAQGFYAKAGFSAQGEIFHEAGIPHLKMVLELS
ncbi:GNAT family N-acetyltransferase [uncultured Microbulbifer sp.]|uniref:GNAT family N-acetyltransferase n=1 Tax=uncultured Microbulbifer sp. TaxID=348147 RepID=UPI0026068C79|nr:GNAT family N-acetyltransferase [uncultured Microbulbifer sp.]